MNPLEAKEHDMDLFSLIALLALTEHAPPAKAGPSCCAAKASAKAPAKAVKAEEYICPLTGQVLPCPACCPAGAKTEK
jgi:hypothetical protein